MKKIAMITDGWKRMVTYAWVDGMVNRIRELGEEICIYQYNCYGNWRKEKKYNQGEYNIFRLPDLNEFDGVVLDCNFTSDKERQQELSALLQQVNVPVISIGHAMGSFYYVGVDNTNPVKEMMEHLHKEHGCVRFLYAGGPKGHNSETVPLCAGSLDALRHIISCENKRVFSFSLGVDAAKRLCRASESYLKTQLDRGFPALDYYNSVRG